MGGRQRMVLSDCFPDMSVEMEEQVADEANIAVVPIAGRVSREDRFSVGSFNVDNDAEAEEADGDSPATVPDVIFTRRRTSLFSLDSQDDGVVVAGQSGTVPGTTFMECRGSLLPLHYRHGIDDQPNCALPCGGAVFASHRGSLFSLNSEDELADLNDSETPPVTYEALHADAFTTRHNGPQRYAVHVENSRRQSWQAQICEASDASDDGDEYEEPAYEVEAIPHPPEPNPTERSKSTRLEQRSLLSILYTCLELLPVLPAPLTY
ncbi:hypothetical protein BKA63DRAFT_522970 [Paraphoma chrysanthemicola]|nr:hypothetical protein BKA63DRAFT_522970 [Paraphoma chrysanthemicola]